MQLDIVLMLLGELGGQVQTIAGPLAREIGANKIEVRFGIRRVESQSLLECRDRIREVPSLALNHSQQVVALHTGFLLKLLPHFGLRLGKTPLLDQRLYLRKT